MGSAIEKALCCDVQTFPQGGRHVGCAVLSASQQLFATVAEKGEAHVWDLRIEKRALCAFTAHVAGGIFCVDWHPTKRLRLATGARDHMVKVWDLARGKGEWDFRFSARVGCEEV